MFGIHSVGVDTRSQQEQISVRKVVYSTDTHLAVWWGGVFQSGPCLGKQDVPTWVYSFHKLKLNLIFYWFYLIHHTDWTLYKWAEKWVISRCSTTHTVRTCGDDQAQMKMITVENKKKMDN